MADDSELVQRINAVLQQFCDGLHVKSFTFYECALTKLGSSHWERMEFLGDAVIGLAAAYDGYCRHASYTEGNLSQYRTSLVRGSTLREMCKFCGVWELLPPAISIHKDHKLEEDVMECFVGALFLDHSFHEASEWFTCMARAYTDVKASWTASTELFRRYCKGRKFDIKFDKQASGWWCSIALDNTVVGYNSGANRRDAEERACSDALEYMGVRKSR
jgi:dsRNA-specific ribonuclease